MDNFLLVYEFDLKNKNFAAGEFFVLNGTNDQTVYTDCNDDLKKHLFQIVQRELDASNGKLKPFEYHYLVKNSFSKSKLTKNKRT